MPLHLIKTALASINFQPWMMGVFIPIVVLAVGCIIVVSGMYFEHRRRQLWHETARIALEKGQPVPAAVAESNFLGTQAPKPADPGSRSRGYFISGVMNIAIGIGLVISFQHFLPLVSYLAAIPICIGVALLIGSWVEKRASRNSAG